jgi:transcription-repair coupling factor (superfamily II helicase)
MACSASVHRRHAAALPVPVARHRTPAAAPDELFLSSEQLFVRCALRALRHHRPALRRSADTSTADLDRRPRPRRSRIAPVRLGPICPVVNRAPSEPLARSSVPARFAASQADRRRIAGPPRNPLADCSPSTGCSQAWAPTCRWSTTGAAFEDGRPRNGLGGRTGARRLRAAGAGIDLITEAELFAGVARRGARGRREAQSDVDAIIRDLSELKPGDPVVHMPSTASVATKDCSRSTSATARPSSCT